MSEARFARLAPLLPRETRGVPRVDDRLVISGILHVPRKTLCNPFVRWAAKRVWEKLFLALSEAGGPPSALMIDATHVKPHRSAAGGKGGGEARAIGCSRGGRTTKIHRAVDESGRPRRLIPRPGHRGDVLVAAELIEGFTPEVCLADAAYDSNALRAVLIEKGATPVIPNNPTRERPRPFDREAWRRRNAIERTFCRLKDWRRVPTRYDSLATNFLATVTIAAIVSYWL